MPQQSAIVSRIVSQETPTLRELRGGEADDPRKSEVTTTIDMTSIDTTNATRDKYLRTVDADALLIRTATERRGTR